MDSIVVLALAAAALAAGPLLTLLPWRQARVHAWLDGFVLVMVVGLCLVSLLPEAIEVVGGWSILIALAGFFLPHLAESRLQAHRHGESVWILGAALIGLLAHSALDGATLSLGAGFHGHGHSADAGGQLGLAVILHRLPVSLFVWWTIRPKFGIRAAGALLVALALSTVLGFAASGTLSPLASGALSGILHAALAGGLLHVVLDHGPRQASGHRVASALGAGLGLLLFALVPKGEDAWMIRASLSTATNLLLESGIAIVLGFLGAGLLSMVPTHTLARLMTGRTNFTSAVRGVVFGLPLPVCSCGVVPLYRGLVQKGVPAAAATSFLIATPELGMDAVIISVPLLGVRLALLRVAAAVLVAMVAGLVAGWLTRDPVANSPDRPLPAQSSRSLGAALRYGFVESVDDLGPWILAGLLLAGTLEPLLTPSLAASLPGWMEVPLFAVLATPLYICAAGATPVAAILLSKGISGGAVIAMLISGPATNITTYGAIRTAHRVRNALILIAIVPLTSILVGWAFNSLGLATVAADVVERHEHHSPWHTVFAVVFALLILASFYRQGPRGFLARVGIGHDHDHDDHDHGAASSEASCCHSEGVSDSPAPAAIPQGRSG